MTASALYPNLRPSLLLDFANSRQLDPRITFTRSTTATYYDGVTTAKAEENLLKYSQEFDNAYWQTAGSVTITANSTTAPDGSSTADTMTEAATTGTHRVAGNNNSVVVSGALTSSTVFTISCYYKIAAGTPYARLSLSDSTGLNQVNAWFKLSDGTLGSTTTPGSATVVTRTITSVGSSWYRCTLSASINAGSDLYAYFSIADADLSVSYAGSTGRAVYLWGAQLEQRSSATAYTATTTQAITNYVPVLQTASAGQARFDHNPTTGESLGLLIEEQRTNLVTGSADFSNASYWVQYNGGVVTANQMIAPDGTLTADQMVMTSTQYSGVYQSGPAGATGTCTISVWARTATGTQTFNIGFYNGIQGAVMSSNLTATTSWQRFTFTATLSGVSNIHINNYTASAGTIFIWGAQLEAGSFATSYIPTVASSVTRTADAASMTGTNLSSWYNNSAGTFYVESQNEYNVTNFAGTGFETYSGFQTNMFFISAKRDGDYARGVTYMSPSGFDLVSLAYANTSATAFYKYAGAMSKTALSTAIMGVGATKTINLGVPPMPTVFAIGSNAYAYNNFVGHIKKLAYYPVGLTVGQLQALTS